jgi:predicted CoA-binding protein
MTPEQQILETCRTIAVVGLSSNPLRPSYEVAQYMQRQGYRIIPVNPQKSEVLGEKCYARLEDVPGKIDCVDVFRRPEFVPAIVESAIAIGARALWLQLDIVDDVSIARARAAGLLAVQDRCLLIEHRRYFRFNNAPAPTPIG